MTKIVLLLAFLMMPLITIAQDLYIENNPYENAEEITKQRNAFKRERWFYEQRMFPNNYLPENGYANALDQRNMLRQSQGFYLDERNTWSNIGPTSGYYFAYGNISSRITT